MEADIALVLGIIGILLLLLFTLFGYLAYSGLFHEVEIRAGKPPFGKLSIAYKFARGPYKNCGQLFTETHNLVPSLTCIGVYYDDPEKVEPYYLRYAVGAILNDPDCPATPEMVNKLVEEHYSFVKFPEIENVISTTFPFKGSVSVLIAVARVYPRMREYVKERKLCAHPILEIYKGNTILFVSPLSKQNEFYVEEAIDGTEESEDEAEFDSGEQQEGSEVEDDEKEEASEKVPSKASSASETQNKENILEGEGTTQAKKDSSTGSGRSSSSSFEELKLDSLN